MHSTLCMTRKLWTSRFIWHQDNMVPHVQSKALSFIFMQCSFCNSFRHGLVQQNMLNKRASSAESSSPFVKLGKFAPQCYISHPNVSPNIRHNCPQSPLIRTTCRGVTPGVAVAASEHSQLHGKSWDSGQNICSQPKLNFRCVCNLRNVVIK